MTGTGHPAAVRVWQGIEHDDPPAERRSYGDLLRMAESMLSTRRNRFPELVAAGRKSAEDASEEIALFEAIVADWRFIVDGTGEPASPITLTARRAALDESLRTIAALAAQQGGFTETLGCQAACVIALRWHLEPGRETIALARLTHQLRAEAAARRKEAASCH